MTDLVTLEEAKAYIRVREDHEDEKIALMIAAASEAVLDIVTGWDRTGEVPARIKLAVLQRVCVMFDSHTSSAPGDGEDRLLLPLRKLGV